MLVAAAATLIGLAGVDADAATKGRFTMQGTVTGVTDADTIRVALRNGKVETVRLVGIDAPERGACFASQATASARSLTDGKRVTLKGDASQDTRDRYGRLLAYVWLPGGKDLGYQLIARGAAKTYVYARPFQRLSAYRAAESRGRRVAPSMWTCGRTATPQPPPRSSQCDPSYPDVCIPPYDRVGDLDCADVPYSNFRVVGSDPHGFDGEGDGLGCED
jgi:micrococcal nuclease